MRHHRIAAVLGILVAAGVGTCATAAESSSSSTEALIKRQSQEFSDASASGDTAVLGRYLDDHVIFMQEDGSLSTRKDIVDGAGPMPAGVRNHLTQTDWHFEQHGNVAVTSFTDELNQDFHGQPFHEKFRSTEVWLKQPAGWRMISSQTLALPEDPPAVALPSRTLDEYVGIYQAGPDVTYTIARQGDQLTGALGDRPPVAMRAEAPDVLFTPGQPRLRKIIQRDASGKVSGFLSRREGHDLVFKRVS